jgi:hypothetical protein
MREENTKFAKGGTNGFGRVFRIKTKNGQGIP